LALWVCHWRYLPFGSSDFRKVHKGIILCLLQSALSFTGSLVTAALISGPASAALDPTDVDAIKAAVLSDAGTAASAGFAVMAVVLGLSVGFGLLSSFIKKGARG
jgi:hypothetical protein